MYAQLPADFDEAPRLVDLELDELGFLACGLSYSCRHTTNGHLPTKAVRAFGRSGRGARVAARLVSKGRLSVVAGGFEIVDYLTPDCWGQPSRTDVDARREGVRARKEAQRKREAGASTSAAVTPSVTRDVTRESHALSTSLHSTRTDLQIRPPPAAASAQPQLQPQRGVREAVCVEAETAEALTAEASPESIAVATTHVARVFDVGTAGCESACETFVGALAEAGWLRAPIREGWERRALVDAINTHLPADGTKLGALAELRNAVTDWVAAFREKKQFTSGWSPRKFGDYLAEGREHVAASPATASALPASSTRALWPAEDACDPATPEREYTADEIVVIDALIASTVERLNTSHLGPAPRRADVAPGVDPFAQSAADHAAARERQLAAIKVLAAAEADEQLSVTSITPEVAA